MREANRNEMFAPGRDPFLFSVPVLWDKEGKFKKLTRDAPPIVTDLEANLAHFRDRYATTLANQRSVDEELRMLGDVENEQDFRAFHGRFYRYIAEELRRADVATDSFP
jgi:hypothetical protein